MNNNIVSLNQSKLFNGKGKNDPIDALSIARCVKHNNYSKMNTHEKKFTNL